MQTIVSWNDHPNSTFQQHPWHDVFAPPPLGVERPPEWELNAPGAPRPEDFPFTEQGRADYYAAVKSAGFIQQAMHHDLMMNAHAAAVEQAAAQAEQESCAALLLLL
jgi:hypothetical protein